MKSKMLKVLGAIGLVVAVAALLMVGCAQPAPAPAPAPAPTPAPATPVTKWIYQPCYGTGAESCWMSVVELWSDMVEEATEGTVLIERLAAGSIASSDESFGACAQGMIDVWSGWATVYGGTVPEGFLAYGLALSSQSTDEAWQVMFGDPKYRVGDIVKEAFLENNLYWAGWNNAGWNMAFTKFPVTKWEDFKGHKMRAGGPQAIFFDTMGVSTVAMPWGDIYMSIKLGTIEGLFGDLASIAPDKLHEVVDYAILPAWNTCQTEEVVINLDSWNALEQWQRDAIDGIFWDFWLKSSYKMYEYYDFSRKACLDAGVEFLVMSDEEVTRMREKVVNEVWPQNAALSPGVAQGVEIYMQFLEDKGRI